MSPAQRIKQKESENNYQDQMQEVLVKCGYAKNIGPRMAVEASKRRVGIEDALIGERVLQSGSVNFSPMASMSRNGSSEKVDAFKTQVHAKMLGIGNK